MVAVSSTSMEMTRHFTAAPWSRILKLVTALGAVLLAGAGIVAYRAIPVPSGFTHNFGLGIALLFPLILVFSLLLTVTGYTVSSSDLVVQRLFWGTRVSLSGLQNVRLDPSLCKGSLRIFGNGGLFSFTGLYYNRRLGRYRLFATNFTNTVLLTTPNRKIVITPANANAFVEHIHHIFPATRVDSE